MGKINLKKEKAERNKAFAKKYESTNREEKKKQRKVQLTKYFAELEENYLTSAGTSWTEFIKTVRPGRSK